MVIIFIKFCVSFPTNIVRVSKANPRKSTGIYLILVLGYLYINRADLWDRLFETNPYRFWYQVIRKNPQPSNVSLQEYAARNRAGYCWRDKKYYSKEELWHKAMKSLTGRMIYENKFYWDNKVVNDNGEFLPTEDECVRWNGCKVFKIPMNPDKENYLKDNIENKYHFGRALDLLVKHNEAESFIFASDKNYINDDFKLKNYILIHRLDNPTYLSVYDSNSCCNVLNKSEWSLIRKNYILKYIGMETVVFTGKSKIPIDIDINSWGVGNFYFDVTYSESISASEFVAKDKSETFKDTRKVYLLNNCGDVLYRPNYWRLR